MENWRTWSQDLPARFRCHGNTSRARVRCTSDCPASSRVQWECLSASSCPCSTVEDTKNSKNCWLVYQLIFFFFFNTIFVSSHMYPENPEGTQVIVGSMNMGYISDTASLKLWIWTHTQSMAEIHLKSHSWNKGVQRYLHCHLWWAVLVPIERHTKYKIALLFFFFQHNFCVKPYVPQRDPSNHRLYEHGIWYIYPTLPGIELTTCSIPSARRSH